MVKNFFSFLTAKKGRSMKRRDSKKGPLFNRVLHYLKSDNYMYAPLISSKNPSFTAFSGVEEIENSKHKAEKLVEKVKKYILSDCYMYAPLILDEHRLRAGVQEIEKSDNEPKKLGDKVKDYMLSDCYMYAPLFLDEPLLSAGVKEIENRENELKKLVGKVKDYMVSDCYMYAPLLSDKPRFHEGGQENDYTENYEAKKSVDKVKEYIVSDCYMYAPLVSDEPWLRAGCVSSLETAVDTSKQGDAMNSVTENGRDIEQNTKSTSISNQRVAEYPLTRKTIIKNTLLQRETVGHVIQQTGALASAKDDEKQEKWGKKRTKIHGSNTENSKRRRKIAGR